MEGEDDGWGARLNMASPPFRVAFIDQHGFEWEEVNVDARAVHGRAHPVRAPVSDEGHQMAFRSHQTGQPFEPVLHPIEKVCFGYGMGDIVRMSRVLMAWPVR